MWYPATITGAAASEPVSVAQAKLQCRIDDADTSFDAELALLIASARDYVEAYCGSRFATQTVALKCDGFADFSYLPEAPLQSVSSVEYVDGAGDDQTLATSVYEVRNDGLCSAIKLKNGQSWPSIQAGSRITVTAVVGYTSAPAAVVHAMLIFIADSFMNRENAAAGEWSVLDSLLCNHRRGF